MARSYIREYGFSLDEIGAHMGITRERVRQLMVKESKRIKVAVKEMRAYGPDGKKAGGKSYGSGDKRRKA